MAPSTICLIIPCYNEARRLDLGKFRGFSPEISFVFVDDGSTDGTADVIRRQRATVNLVVIPKNQGKAEAVRQGMLHAKQEGLLARTEWIGYWDADLATPLEEVDAMLAYAATLREPVDAILGSRVYKLGSTIHRSFARHIAGRVFATIASTLLKLDCYDSQCGAKLFRPELIDEAFGGIFVSRWIFDIEVLLRLRQRHLVEYPLRSWNDVAGGKTSVASLVIPTLIDLYRIWRRYPR
jgi:dolichyl-phosphate beta-glucosyltransferase